MKNKIAKLLKNHADVKENISRAELIQETVLRKEAILTKNNTLAVWTEGPSTGRSPKDTVTVRRPESEDNIDWTSSYNIPVTEETFDMIFDDAILALENSKTVFKNDRAIGAAADHALPVRVISSSALTSVFVDNMFRPIPEGIEKSIFASREFTILVLPKNKLNADRYNGRLRKLPEGKTTDMAVAIDYDRRLGVVFGSSYCGSVKKMLFTVMNYYLPLEKILPLHCSANEGKNGDIALFLGLSGTGKTTLSADPDRALLGDDEHSWNEKGISNFENGCYAKLINLNPEKEPEIYEAIFHDAPVSEHGAIIENVMVYPDGSFDLDDGRYTENSRGSYPLSFLKNIKKESTGSHPKVIIFLTADATGVLPPVAKLTEEQAMLWFMMGYTSKLAGTETGVLEPSATFSRFFGEPFMPCKPEMYASLLGEKMKQYGTSVYLVNTGWSGGAYGVGKRMDINLTRAILRATLNGELDKSEYVEDKLFHIMIPRSCPGVDADILNPRNTWADKDAYDKKSVELAGSFAKHFDKTFKGKVSEELERQCPGK